MSQKHHLIGHSRRRLLHGSPVRETTDVACSVRQLASGATFLAHRPSDAAYFGLVRRHCHGAARWWQRCHARLRARPLEETCAMLENRHPTLPTAPVSCRASTNSVIVYFLNSAVSVKCLSVRISRHPPNGRAGDNRNPVISTGRKRSRDPGQPPTLQLRLPAPAQAGASFECCRA